MLLGLMAECKERDEHAFRIVLESILDCLKIHHTSLLSLITGLAIGKWRCSMDCLLKER
jgi:hypothetical protein